MTDEMTLQQLSCFVAVVDAGGFSLGASLVGLSQPALSTHIGNLERALGVELFDRATRPPRLSTQGEELLGYAREILSGVVGLREAAVGLGDLRRGLVRVGVTQSLSVSVMPKVIGIFRDAYPGIKVAVTERGSEELEGALERGEIDLALVVLHPDQEAAVALGEEELVVIVGDNHALSTRERIRIEELENEPLVEFAQGYELRASTSRALKAAHIKPLIGVEGVETSSVVAYVRAGLGWAIVPYGVAQAHAGIRAISLEPPAKRRIGLLMGSSKSKAAQELARILGEIGNEIFSEEGVK